MSSNKHCLIKLLSQLYPGKLQNYVLFSYVIIIIYFSRPSLFADSHTMVFIVHGGIGVATLMHHSVGPLLICCCSYLGAQEAKSAQLSHSVAT